MNTNIQEIQGEGEERIENPAGVITINHLSAAVMNLWPVKCSYFNLIIGPILAELLVPIQLNTFAMNYGRFKCK